MIIGFLTYLYRPEITSFFVGLQGARVPLPIVANREIVNISMRSPDEIIRQPVIVTKML